MLNLSIFPFSWPISLPKAMTHPRGLGPPGRQVSILPEIQNGAGDGVAFVGLRSHAPVEAAMVATPPSKKLGEKWTGEKNQYHPTSSNIFFSFF